MLDSPYTHYDVLHELGQNIQRVRKEQKWTQKQAALRADIPLSTYALIEQTGEGSIKNLVKIFMALGRDHELLDRLLTPIDQTPIERFGHLLES
jgi:transcriptional regulator with XRE-family HTH domain